MKNFKQFIINLTVGFALLNIFGALFLTGESFPQPIPSDMVAYTKRSVP
jgi:hypothetical protein